MKKVISIFIFLYCCGVNSQQLVQTTSDVYKLEVNKEAFVNKPLKNLLKEIKPEIKIAFVLSNEDGLFEFIFKFITRDQLRNEEGSIDDRVTLFVDVNEFIDWIWDKRPKGKEPNWTKKDVRKYGNLTVKDIRVFKKKETDEDD